MVKMKVNMEFCSMLLFFVWLFYWVKLSRSCNDIICGSVVSKCMLTQSCKCDLKNCSCCKECHDCLSTLYSECCSCVDLCPKRNESKNFLLKQSHVEEFEGIPDLFNALTAEPEPDKWNTVVFPIDLENFLAGLKTGINTDEYFSTNHNDEEKNWDRFSGKSALLNCTVVYSKQCLSLNKCKTICESMGAKSFRWFHDGCCECVGSTCINFGINESKCSDCPHVKKDSNNMEWVDEDYEDTSGPLDEGMDTNI